VNARVHQHICFLRYMRRSRDRVSFAHEVHLQTLTT